MKTQDMLLASKTTLCLAAVATILQSAPAQAADNYAASWRVVAGGGGTSTGSVYSVSGTIGQPDAGSAMSGGNYSVTAGFWALYAMQTPGAPLLKILLTTTNTAVVSWPAPSTGFSLQQNPDPSTTNWVAPAETINSDGATKFIILSPPTGQRFYRLKN